MKRNEIYQIWLDGNGAREGKTSDYRKSFKKKINVKPGKIIKLHRSVIRGKIQKFRCEKKQEIHSEVIEIKRLGQTVRKKQLCVKHEKLK